MKDVVVVGSGGAGMTAAVACAKLGLRVLLIEKSEWLGGTTALSGGGIWIPANTQARHAGFTDTVEAARRYLCATIGSTLDERVLDAFLAHGAEMVDWLEANTDVKFEVMPGFPDWFPEADGATQAGRLLSPIDYDGRALGKHFAELRPPLSSFNAPGGFMIALGDMPHLSNATKSLVSFKHMAKLLLRFARDRITYPRGTRLTMGNALMARFLRTALAAGVEIWRNAPAVRLRAENGRVTGIVVQREGRTVEVSTRCGVVLASGGFSANPIMRAKYIPYAEHHVSLTPESNTGDGLSMALELGAAMEEKNHQNGAWVVMSVDKDEKFPHLFLDRGKPGCIAVNASGRRFSNEAAMDMVERMHASGSVPAHLVCDHRFMRKYGLGLVKPGAMGLKKRIASGYIKAANTLAELAAMIGVDAAGLAATVARANEQARTGLDTDFGKGSTPADFPLGDMNHKPNPCLGPIETAPFYALKIQPGDSTTTLGLRIDGEARVLDTADLPIRGLYAAGLDMNSLWRGRPPGNGANNALSLTFGFIAAKSLAAQRAEEHSYAAAS